MSDFEQFLLSEMERCWPPRLERGVSQEDYETIRVYFFGRVGRNSISSVLIHCAQCLYARNPEVIQGLFPPLSSAVKKQNLTVRDCCVVVHYLYHEYGLDSSSFYQRLDNAVFFAGHALGTEYLYIPGLNVSFLRS